MRFMLVAALTLAASIPANAGSPSPPAAIEKVHQRVNDLLLTDCKAAAFEKIRRLESAGIKAVFAAVRTETGGYHAIAVVDRTWALDSRFRWVMRVQELRALGYEIAPTVDGSPRSH